MNRIFLGLLLAIWSLTATAGPLLDKFHEDVAAFLAAQAQNPNRVIRYVDDQGALARAVLNPNRMASLYSESTVEIDSPDRLKAAIDAYKPISLKYARAFEQMPGRYDEEFFDSYEVLFHFLMISMKPTKNIQLDQIKDESMRPLVEAALKMAKAVPNLLLKGLDKYVEEGRFSASYMPVAKSRITALRAAANSN